MVARYYYQIDYNGSVDPAIGSIAMLGTPNLGVNIAKYERWLCPRWSRVVPVISRICTLVDIVSAASGLDPHSKVIDDFKPDSEVLGTLNIGFTSPVSPIYRAHVGVNTTWFGNFFSGSGPNDCFISNESTFGPIASSGPFSDVAVFGPDARYRREPYVGVSHSGGIPSCDDSNKLTNNTAVVANLLPDIKPYLGIPALPPDVAAAAPLALSPAPPSEIAALRLMDSGVTDGVTNTHMLSLPAGVANATFSAFWIGGETPPNLSVEVLRPGGTPVSPSDADVLEPLSMDGSAASFYLAGAGFTIANPAAGDWSVRVTGVATGPDGAPYMAGVFPDSQVALGAGTTADVVLSGGAQTATAQLLDGVTPVAATISARLINVNGTEQTLALVDDGTNGDAVAGDKLYSRTVPTAGACGTVRLLLSADATGTSEGAVHREQVASFDVHVSGDAARDPCNSDDDGDGLTDEIEVNTYRTNPMSADSDADLLSDSDEISLGTDPTDPDTDGDGMNDGYEVANACLQVLVADGTGDPDSDGINSVGEFQQGTLACNPDTDGDGRKDRPQLDHVGPANTLTTRDNCPLVANPSQTNTDGNFIDMSPPLAVDDRSVARSDALGDACDPDDDNDGLSDAIETGTLAAFQAACPAATAVTNPLLGDSDGDRVLDGAECALGFDPMDPASRPSAVVAGDSDGDSLSDAFEAVLGSNPNSTDSDGDGALDGIEYKGYNTSLILTDTDGDGCTDGKEIASVDGIRNVNAIDLQQVAKRFALSTPAGVDVNKDGNINSLDLQFVARQYGNTSGSC